MPDIASHLKIYNKVYTLYPYFLISLLIYAKQRK